MAGHSKYKNIMYRKGAQDKKRSGMFSKLSREITVAAKMGLPDPDMNPRLRAAVNAAKAQSMPKDNIQRSIDKATEGRRRELRGNPLRGVRPRRRLADRRGADRQPQPHRHQRAHRDLARTAAISARRDRSAMRFDRMGLINYPGQGRRRRQGVRGGAGGGRRGCLVERGRPRDLDRAGRACTKSPRRWSRCSARPRARSSPGGRRRWSRSTRGDAGTLFKLIDALDDDDDVQTVWGNYEVSDAVMEKLG